MAVDPSRAVASSYFRRGISVIELAVVFAIAVAVIAGVAILGTLVFRQADDAHHVRDLVDISQLVRESFSLSGGYLPAEFPPNCVGASTGGSAWRLDCFLSFSGSIPVRYRNPNTWLVDGLFTGSGLPVAIAAASRSSNAPAYLRTWGPPAPSGCVTHTDCPPLMYTLRVGSRANAITSPELCISLLKHPYPGLVAFAITSSAQLSGSNFFPAAPWTTADPAVFRKWDSFSSAGSEPGLTPAQLDVATTLSGPCSRFIDDGGAVVYILVR